MKRIFYLLTCIALVFATSFIVGCSDNSDDDNDDLPNEVYYQNLGYHTITFDKYTSIVADKENMVVISDSKCMVANNTTISLNFNLDANEDFVSNNENFVNFKNGTILSNFKVNSNHYEVNDATIVVKDDLTIKANLVDFQTIGIAINSICKLVPTKLTTAGKFNEINTTLSKYLYFYANTTLTNPFEHNNLITNTTINSSIEKLANNNFNLKISAEIYDDTTEIFTYLILEDINKNYYLYNIEIPTTYLDTEITISNLSNNNSKLKSIKLTMSYDITVKDEYM